MADEEMLDLLVDAFSDEDEYNTQEVDNNDVSFKTTVAEKSVFYKSALEDQTWFQTPNGKEVDERNGSEQGTPSSPSEATPTGTPAQQRRQPSLSAMASETRDSFVRLPSAARSSSKDLQSSPAQIDDEMDRLRKRLNELEEQKSQLRPTKPKDTVEPSPKVRECPIDFTLPHGQLGIDSEEPPSYLNRDSSDDEEENVASFISQPQRSSVKRKSDFDLNIGNTTSSSSKGQRSAVPSANDGATAALREKAKDVASALSGSTVGRGSNTNAYDSFFGIKIHTPKISSVTFQSYVGIREKVRISELTSDKSINWDDWVTMGVVVDKTPLKTSANGNQFAIWKLSDLVDCQRVVRVLLFGDSGKAVCKLNKGDVVAILNADKMENKGDGFQNDKANVVTIKVDSKQKIVELGYCPDYGICKGTRKQDNLNCTNFVNKSKSEYCDFHVMTASRRLASKRGEFQLASNVPPKKFNNPTKKVLPNIRVSRLPIKGGVASAAAAAGSSVVGGPSGAKMGAPNQTRSADLMQLQEVLRVNTVGSRHVKTQLAISNESGTSTTAKSTTASGPSSTKPKMTCKQFLAVPTKPAATSSQLNRQLVKGEAAKLKAIALLRNRSALPNAASKSIKPKKDAPAPTSNVDQDSDNAPPPSKRPRLLGQISNLTKEKLIELANQKSTHDSELIDEDAKRQEEYFKIMEAKEKVDQRATEVMSLKGCKVVTCKTCKYTWHAQSTLCKQNSHAVQWHTAEKRFFRCRACSTRTVAYDKYPNKPCQCGSTTFERVAMRQESKGPQLVGETLKVRGEEEPFVN